MSWLTDAYSWVDKILAGGLLPGGYTGGAGVPLAAPVGQAVSTVGSALQTLGGQPAAAAGTGTIFAGGAALSAAMGMPVTAPRAAAPRGKTVTAVASVDPVTGAITPRRMIPGRPLVMSSDIAAVKRVRKARGVVNRILPATKRRTRRLYRASRKSSKK